MTAVRPPADITPGRFFEEWLPAQLAAAPRGNLKPMTVRVSLDGDGGGAWDLKIDGGLTVVKASAADPEVTILQTVQDWKAIAVGEAGAVNLAPPQSSPMDILFLDRAAQDVLGAVRGTIRFEVTGYNGRTWQLTVKFGPQPLATEPNATISVDAETYAGMLARTIPPPQAYFTGKIKLLGDAGLAMQLAMAMMPRFS
jgi:putative sterol carrier protein